MAPLDKVAFANKATRLIGGRNGATMVAAAFVAVAVAGGAGIFLADRVDKMQEELKNSQFVAALTASGEKSRITQILADPESSELFLKYVNAMAAVLTNLEQSPAEQFKQFEAILAAQEASGVKIESFLCDDPAGRLQMLSVQARGAPQAAKAFQESLGASGCFCETELSVNREENGQEFTINCYFSHDDL